MMDLLVTAPPRTTASWTVQLQAQVTRAYRHAAADEDVEPVVELMRRTDGVLAASVVPLGRAGLTLGLVLRAPDAARALERARSLAASGARYAGLGELTILHEQVTAEPAARTPEDWRMHEMAVARRLVAEALDRTEDEGGGRLTGVEVVLGSTGRLSAESVREHFQLAARGTPAEQADVRISWAPGRYWCFDCMYEFSSHVHGSATCPRCGSAVLSLDREELAYVRSIGVEPA